MLSIIHRDVHVIMELDGEDTSYLDFYFNDLYKYKDIIEFTNTFLRCNDRVKNAIISIKLNKDRWDETEGDNK